jgi:hypothetical protein
MRGCKKQVSSQGFHEKNSRVVVNHDNSVTPDFDENKDLKLEDEENRFNKNGAGFKSAPTATTFMSPAMNMKNHSLSEIVRGFKTFSAYQINKMRNTQGETVWQRGYYDRFIRDEKELNGIRAYVRLNPKRWDKT